MDFKLFLLFLTIFTIFNVKANNDVSGRIAGGQRAELDQFPWHVNMITNGAITNMMCGGALIRANWVLTAGMCLIQPRIATLYFGVIDRLSTEISYIFQVTDPEHFILHPEYDAWNPIEPFDNNIALIYLKSFDQTLPTLSNVGVVQLPHDYASENFVDSVATAAGFGITEDSQVEMSQYLNYVEMPVITNEICNEAYNGAINENKMCTNTTGGRSTCNGDFGAPLTIHRNNQAILIGVGSLGYLRGCTLEQPAAFTRVTRYLDWIDENVGTAPPDEDDNCVCDCICHTCDEVPPRDEL